MTYQPASLTPKEARSINDAIHESGIEASHWVKEALLSAALSPYSIKLFFAELHSLKGMLSYYIEQIDKKTTSQHPSLWLCYQRLDALIEEIHQYYYFQ